MSPARTAENFNEIEPIAVIAPHKDVFRLGLAKLRKWQ